MRPVALDAQRTACYVHVRNAGTAPSDNINKDSALPRHNLKNNMPDSTIRSAIMLYIYAKSRGNTASLDYQKLKKKNPLINTSKLSLINLLCFICVTQM